MISTHTAMATTLLAVVSDANDKHLPRKKILLLGDSNVGKSNILFRFVRDAFYSDYIPTVGCDFLTKIKYFNGEEAKLIIWDTSGQRRFDTITKPYISGCDLIIIVYNKTNKKSFENIRRWLDMVNDKIKDPNIILVGNKADLVDQIQVSTEMGQQFASDHGMTFVETSALSGMGIEAVFNYAASFDIKEPGEN